MVNESEYVLGVMIERESVRAREGQQMSENMLNKPGSCHSKFMT